MTLDEQLQLKQLQDKGYCFWWKAAPYVSLASHGQIVEITKDFLKDLNHTNGMRIGEYAYKDDCFLGEPLRSLGVGAFMIFKTFQFENIVKEIKENK